MSPSIAAPADSLGGRVENVDTARAFACTRLVWQGATVRLSE
ncbi:hypothetical protein [Arthrobacter sp. 260]|nr:hypothetical protein [Arthrobacter sp. 260]